ncbi:unnamed protein product [Rangifer tarandus platyrhynchus]|uniref:Uncharacterized protein n=1 Tax=Rangifer tarandus platyrhynchus TaxID=3082113 RepID=A0ABN8XUD8_RANTA|nr:unnamed protein product [Rangifer tarandus platyrhynchus]
MREGPASLFGGSGICPSPRALAPPTRAPVHCLSVTEGERQASTATSPITVCSESLSLLFRNIPLVLHDCGHRLCFWVVLAQEFSTVIPGPGAAAASPWSLLENANSVSPPQSC